jgi:leucyl aminopeptidase
MNKIDIFLINNSQIKSNIELTHHSGKIKINVYELTNYHLVKELDKISNLMKLCENSINKLKRINIIFDSSLNTRSIDKILTKMNDILYNYYPVAKEIKIYQITESSNYLMTELTLYKNIVMDPNKTPESYLEYVKTNTPHNYMCDITNVNNTNLYPLTKAVGAGSKSNSYWVHIYPKTINLNNKNIYLIGKAVTFDAGGLNIKTQMMEDMKVDMTGSAIILSVLRLLNYNKVDTHLNIHLIIPIVENMVGPTGLKPGAVIQTMLNKKIEITNTDAEGRLCLVDGLDYVQSKLLNKKKSNLIIDIATLTGNTLHITSGISSLVMANNKAHIVGYVDKLITIGEDIGEYIDYLKIRKEYLDMLISPVADIKNINMSEKAGCVIAGTFLHYFVDENIPWIHIDLGVCTFVNQMANAYGVNLLYEFIKQIK